MKPLLRFFGLCSLVCGIALLGGCPDAKPPKDPTLLPTPKAAPGG